MTLHLDLLVLLAVSSLVSSSALISPYNYPVPGVGFNAGRNTKVVVETVKSISPPEYLPPSGSFSNTNNNNGVNVPTAPTGSVTYNAYQAPVRPPTIVTAKPITRAPARRPGNLASYRYYNPEGSSSGPTATPTSARTPSVEVTTARGGYQYSRPATTAASAVSTTRLATTDGAAPAVAAVTIGGNGARSSTAGRVNGYNYNRPSGPALEARTTAATSSTAGSASPSAVSATAGAVDTTGPSAGPTATSAAATTTTATSKVTGKASGKVTGYNYPTPKINGKSKLSQKIADSKPEESGLNGYSYNLPGYRGSSLGLLGPSGSSSGSGGSGGGMMGASYMRSRGTHYNYHVMLD